MPRAVEEWVGKTEDSTPSAACKRRILAKQNYCCALSGILITDGEPVDFDHIVELWKRLPGAPPLNRESNLQAVLRRFHKNKTAEGARERSKSNRKLNAAFGLKKPKGRPMPGSKASGLKKGFDGKVTRR